MTNRKEILDYVQQAYGTEPDYPWIKYPDYAVLRHYNNRKWYGVILAVKPAVIGLKGEQAVDILNLKCDVMFSDLFRHPAIMPGYHMNKKNWISVLLDSDFPKEDLFKLIDLSYELTR